MELYDGTGKKVLMKKKTSLHDIQKILATKGELCNDMTTETRSEKVLGQALIDEGIQVVSDFKIGGKSFDFKVYHYPILLEVDGVYHTEKKARLRDYKKDRMAQKLGYRVFRFTNGEVNDSLQNCIQEVKACINKVGHVPREIWVYEYTIIDRLKDWWKKRK